MSALMTLPVRVGLGTNTFARTTDPDTSRLVLDAYATAGGTLMDTADTFSDGAAETIIGDWMQQHGNRDSMTRDAPSLGWTVSAPSEPSGPQRELARGWPADGPSAAIEDVIPSQFVIRAGALWRRSVRPE